MQLSHSPQHFPLVALIYINRGILHSDAKWWAIGIGTGENSETVRINRLVYRDVQCRFQASTNNELHDVCGRTASQGDVSGRKRQRYADG